MTAVVFVPADFTARYPEFSSLSDSVLFNYFDEATLYLSNSDDSPVQNVDRRKLLLWMMTAHCAVLGGAISVGGQVSPVGRVNSASQGSVSASFSDIGTGTEQWFMQTQYGASFMQATINIRSFRYVAYKTRY